MAILENYYLRHMSLFPISYKGLSHILEGTQVRVGTGRGDNQTIFFVTVPLETECIFVLKESMQ